MMEIYAGFAQEESKNMSDNIQIGYSRANARGQSLPQLHTVLRLRQG